MQYLLAAAYFKLNRTEDAISLYDDLLKNDDAAMLHDEVKFNLALCYLRVKPMQKEIAMAFLRNTGANSSNPFYVKARVLMTKF
ncbi:MAG: tetratricopeptide repeat protein [Saprospiraceae bacterium]|nr:tetratricopeptide repeat protein [Saprospiraceae bacterium]